LWQKLTDVWKHFFLNGSKICMNHAFEWATLKMKFIKVIIIFMVLYSIIKPYNSFFFVINCYIALQDFILNDLFSGGRNPSKILKFTSQTFSTSIVMMSHKHKQKVAQKFYKWVIFKKMKTFHFQRIIWILNDMKER
jgi:hypothetical protein